MCNRVESRCDSFSGLPCGSLALQSLLDVDELNAGHHIGEELEGVHASGQPLRKALLNNATLANPIFYVRGPLIFCFPYSVYVHHPLSDIVDCSGAA